MNSFFEKNIEIREDAIYIRDTYVHTTSDGYYIYCQANDGRVLVNKNRYNPYPKVFDIAFKMLVRGYILPENWSLVR